MFKFNHINSKHNSSSTNILILQNIDKRLKNMDRKVYQNQSVTFQTKKNLATIQSKIQNYSEIYSKKLDNVQLQIQEVDKRLKEDKKISEINNKNQIKKINSIMQKINLKSLEEITKSNFGKNEFNLNFEDNKIQQYQSQLQLIKNQFSEEQQQRNQTYTQLVSEVGEQIQQIQVRINNQRQIRSSWNQNLKKMILQIQQTFSDKIEQETSQRIKNQQNFTRLLEEACLNLENQLINQV